MKQQELSKKTFSSEYEGYTASHIDEYELLAAIKYLPNQLAEGTAKKISQHYDSVIYLESSILSSTGGVAVKSFGRQNFLKDWYDWNFSTQAQRSFEAAELLLNNNIGTPRAIGWINQWHGRRLKNSFYLSEFVESISVREALASIDFESADSTEITDLLSTIALAIRSMHDSGFFHGDLGNQNIMLPIQKLHNGKLPMFIDLNRYKFYSCGLSLRERSVDLARLLLPKKHRQTLFEIYADGNITPSKLWKVAERKRRLIAIKKQTRPLRHPIRTLRGEYKNKSSETKLKC